MKYVLKGPLFRISVLLGFLLCAILAILTMATVPIWYVVFGIEPNTMDQLIYDFMHKGKDYLEEKLGEVSK